MSGNPLLRLIGIQGQKQKEPVLNWLFLVGSELQRRNFFIKLVFVVSNDTL